MDTLANKTQALIADIAADMRRRHAVTKCRDARLSFASAADKHDALLRSIVSSNTVRPVHGGMAGAMMTVCNAVDADFYKRGAAKHLLNLRQLRRWHGGTYTSKSMLADAAFCRRRAAGIEPMPQVVIFGGTACSI